jgi:carbonic anhydrase
LNQNEVFLANVAHKYDRDKGCKAMSCLEEILSYNEKFVKDKQYEQFATDKYPDKRLLIVTCMDTRLTELLPKALNLKNGDAKILKTAGAFISEPYGSLMRSLLVGVTLLKVEEVMVIGHHDCGLVGLTGERVLEKLKERGITEEKADEIEKQGVDAEKWLSGIQSVEEGVMESVRLIQNHPFFPRDVLVHGLTIDPETGKLEVVYDGRKK